MGSAQGPGGLAIDPAGKFLFATEISAGTVAAFTINSATGALTAVQGSPFPASTFPAQAAVDPTGKFLYVSNYNDPAGGVSAYTINSTSGALTAIAGSPFPTQAFGGPAGLAVHSGGKFLYVSLAGTANPNHLIAAFTIDTATGALGPVVGSPFSAGLAPLHIALDPTGSAALRGAGLPDWFFSRVFSRF